MDNERENRLLTSVEALTDIDDALISEAFGAKRKPRVTPYIAAAAAAILILGGAFAAFRLMNGTEPPDITAMRTDAPQPTLVPLETPAPLPTEAPTDAPQATAFTTGEPAASTDEPLFTGEPAATEAPANTPQATQKQTPKATGTPRATAPAAPTVTPKATGKPTAAPTPGPTHAPADATSEPGVTPSYYEITTIEELAQLARQGALGHNVDKLYVPAGVPEGARLSGIRANGTFVEYAHAFNGSTLKFKWMIHYAADEYFAKIRTIAPGGEWHGEYYIADTTVRQVHWTQYGKVFVAELPLSAGMDFIESYCSAGIEYL